MQKGFLGFIKADKVNKTRLINYLAKITKYWKV